MFDPLPDLPDDTLIEMVRLPTIVRNALISAGLKTIGDIRTTTDRELLGMRRLGKGTVTSLRRTLGGNPSDPLYKAQACGLTPRD